VIRIENVDELEEICRKISKEICKGEIECYVDKRSRRIVLQPSMSNVALSMIFGQDGTANLYLLFDLKLRELSETLQREYGIILKNVSMSMISYATGIPIIYFEVYRI